MNFFEKIEKKLLGWSLSIGLVLLLFAAIALTSCGESATKDQPSAVKGVLDLRNGNWTPSSAIDLRGEWEFYWDKFLESSVEPPPFFQKVPGRWTQLSLQGKPLSPNGRGTYRLQILLPETSQSWALRLNQIDRAYRVFINGKEFPTGFQVSDSSSHEGGFGASRYFVIPPASQVTLVLQVSSHFDSWGGGLPVAPSFGEVSSVFNMKTVFGVYEVFFAGILLIMGLYHLMLFLIERHDKALLVFALICLAALVRQLSIDESFLFTLIQLPDELIRRLSWTMPYLLVALFVLFFDLFFPQSPIRLVSFLLKSYGFLMAGLCLVTSQAFYGLSLLQNLYIAFSIIYVFFILGRATWRQEPYSRVLLIGTLFITFAATLDIINASSEIFPVYFLSLGIIPFLLTLSHSLAQRYTQGTRDAESLRIKNSKLAELDEAKTNFFANVSHELRTPLTLIMGPLESIQKGSFGAELPQSHPVFNLMRRNTSRVLKLVENLLKIAKMESGNPPRWTSVNLPSTFRNYLDEFQSLAESSAVTLKLVCCLSREESDILSDPQDLETIALNLLSNAIKYTQSGGIVTVTLKKLSEGSQPMLLIEVADTGVGIPEVQLNKLFQRFKRVYDESRTNYEGTGIGLSIAKEAALRLGGDIHVQSRPGKGSVFTVHLPVRRSEGPAQTMTITKGSINLLASDLTVPHFSIEWPASAEKKHGTRKKILLVEDNSDLRQYLSSFLGTDFEVIPALDGQQALELLESENGIELIVSDIMMPRMDGFTFFEAVRKQSLNVPFLFLTALASDEERLDKLRKGALDYLLKPFSPDELKAKILSILEWQEQGRRELKKKLLSVLNDEAAPSFVVDWENYGLSEREKEVLELLAHGQSDKEIAAELGLSQRTVSNHVSNLLKKTGKKSRVEVMGVLIREGQKLT